MNVALWIVLVGTMAQDAKKADALPAEQPAAAPQAFVLADVPAPAALAKRLKALGDAELPPVVGWWKDAAAPTKEAVGRLAAGGSADADRTALLAALNGLLDDKNLADKLGLPAAQRAEHDFLLQLASKTPGEVTPIRVYNRKLLERAFAFDLKGALPDPQLLAAARPKAPESNVSQYPPKRPDTVKLVLTAPQLRGRLSVWFDAEDVQAVRFKGDEAQTINVPNTGSLAYRLVGDAFGKFERKIVWNPDQVENGAVERTIRIGTLR